MKNIFSKTTEKRTQNGVKSYLCPTFVLSPILIFAFLTLGVGQMWGDTGLYDCYFTYNDGSNHSQSTGDVTNKSLGTLSSNLTIKSVYLKVWDNNGSGSRKLDNGQLCYTKDNWANTSYVGKDSWTQSAKDGNNYELQKSSVSWVLASTTDPSGSYTLSFYWQAWGDGDKYLNNSGSNYKFTYKILPPNVNEGNAFGVEPTNKISGTGTSEDPFVIAYGSNTTFTVSANKTHADANSKLKVSFNNGSTWFTGATATTTTITSGSMTPTTAVQNFTIKVKHSNSTDDCSTVSSRTIYYRSQIPGITVVAGSNGKVRKSTGDSWASSATITPVAASTNYNIYAQADSYYKFKNWTTSDGSHSSFASSTSASTTVSLSAGYSAVTTVTANFEEQPYTITIVGGTAASTTATISTTKGTATAKAPFGMHFTGWTIPNSNFTLVGCTTSSETITFNATAAGTVTANFAQTHAYIEGRFHVTNASRNGSWTNTFANNDDDSWEEASRSIEFSYDTENHYYYLHTYAKPSELTSNISNQVPWFFIKSSPSTASWTGVTVNRPHASGDSNQQLTADGDANKKLADATSGTNSFRFNSSDESGYVVIGFKEFSNKPYIYYWLEQTLEYSGNGNTGGSAPASKTYYNKGTSVQAAANSYTKSGYSFTGWNTKANGSGSAVAASGWYTLNANTTFYAQWSEDNYTVIVQAGEHGSVASGSVTGHKDTKVTLPTATADPGYYFTGWTRVSGSTVTWTNQSSATAAQVNGLTSGVTVQANFAPLWTLKGGKTGQSDWSLDAHIFTSYVVNDQSHNEGQQSFTLDPNTTYRIKLRNRQTSSDYGLASGAATTNVYYATSNNWWVMTNASGNQNLIVNTAAGGMYNFYWDIDDNELFVLYPTSWYITTGQSDAAGGSYTAVDNSSNNVKGGKFVANDATVTFTANKNTGYTFDGWFYNADYDNSHKYVDNDANINLSGTDNKVLTLSSIEEDKAAYAKFTAKTYTVTLTRAGTGYGSGGTASVTATYNQTLPAATMPTAANGYAFMGYYTAEGGEGSQIVAANGTWQNVAGYTSGGKWVLDAGATLYAYYKKAEITNVAISPSTMVAPATELTITPTVSPTPTGTTKLCYYVLHNGGSMVDPQPAMTLTSTNAKLTLPGTSGTYKIAVTLRTGSSCGGGTLLDSVVTNVVIASDHTVTIKYLCDGEPVKASTTISGKPLAWSSSFTPGDDPFGYTFVEWRAGDGVTISTNGSSAISGTTTTTRTIYIKANYDGVLTAVYRQRGIIYFKKPSDWSGSASVYYYNIGSSGKWKDSGDGKYGLYTNDITYGGQAMTRIGTSNIYYYDYEATGTTSDDPGQYIAFSNKLQNGYQPMTGCQVSWPIEYTKGFNTGTPMFVCANYRYHQWLADYYNGGYWTKYHPDWSEEDYTGYTLKIYNQKASSGRKELKSVKFTSTSENMTYKAVVELEAGQTYGFKFVRDDGMYYKNDNDGTYTYSNRNDYWPFVFDGSDGDACGLRTTATGNYTFTMAYYEDSHDIRINVSYPIANNDYRLIYKDNIHLKWHPSANISKRNNAKDTVSFFVRKDKNPIVKIQTASVNASTGAVTWNDYTGGNLLESIPSVISDKSDYGVYNFNLQTDGSGAMSLESIDEYTGEYYIRTDNVTNKWDSYKNADHMMTYTEFSENRETNTFGPLYSHYFCHWCECGTNIKFTIANDYSPCISDTLTAGEFANTDASGTLKTDSDPATDNTSDIYSANIRFMWNRKTNEIGRAYVASATTAARQFLVLKGCNTIKNSDGSSLSGTGESAAENRAIFKDNQDWIYERMIQIQPGTHAKLYACYAKNPIDVSTAQYFRGAYDSGNCSNEESSTNSIQIIGGSGSSFYVVRVIYDFKTNRLITAWMPNGTDITSNVEVDADVMVIRDHQDAAECITFSGSGKLSKVKTVYGVMRFNRWTLNNRYRGLGGVDDQNPEHCSSASAISTHHGVLPTEDQKSSHERGSYFVSFPFDVKLSEVFGFGTYGTHWIISTYNGARRAQRGFFYDNCVNEDCTNWDYVIESEGYNPKTFVMEKYKGYLLQLDLDLMEYDNTAFWTNNISQKELYFPSQVAMESITSTEATMPALDDEQYLCTINHDIPKGSNPEGDRRMKDSYWRCIGVPSYATYGAVLKKDNSSGATITWNSDRTWKANVKNYPFLYEWNPEDNTISVRATSRYEFKPMHAYLVQNGNAIYWSAVSATPASIVRRVYEEEDKEYLWEIELQYNNKVADRTYLRLSNDELITDTFDLNQDLIKEFNNSRSNIYTLTGIEKVAANSRTIHSEETTTIPLGLVIKTAGDYTIAIPAGTNGVGVTLIDEETGVRTSLSALDYTVNLAAGDYTNRFWLEISPIAQTPTGVETVTGEGLPVTGAQKVLIDGILYIVKDGKLFDARGARVE